MSKFFRSPDSDSSSESDDADIDDITNDDLDSIEPSNSTEGNDVRRTYLQSAASREAPAENGLTVNPRPVLENHYTVESSAGKINSTHRDILLHALLEERCLNEAIALHRNAGLSQTPQRDSPEIQSRAQAMYQNICTKLASLNMISSELQQEQHARTRQRYRDGLDILSRQHSSSTVPPRLRRLLTNVDAEVAPQSSEYLSREESLGDATVPAFPLRRLLANVESGPQTSSDYRMQLGTTTDTNLTLRSPGLYEPRYLQEFEELSLLGRGGYGIVYHVRHRLDNQFYAIKKVPLSAARVQRILRDGRSGLDEVLRELRTLARLDHPNIVRYYTGWIEWVEASSSTKRIQSGEDYSAISDTTSSAGLGATEDSTFESSPIKAKINLEHANIVFEESGRIQSAVEPSTRLRQSSYGMETKTAEIASDRSQWSHQVIEDLANGSKGTAESIGRSDDTSANLHSSFDDAHFKEPTLALHMQMSLHPMTLADYLSPAFDAVAHAGAVPPLSHCYHLEPSISILLAILDGIEYLHGEGIIHRDIKPGNIFLGRKDNPRSTRGSVDLMLCSECRAQRKAAPIRLEIRIGDFGLVTFADPNAQKTASQDDVGTEIYRPASKLFPKAVPEKVHRQANIDISSQDMDQRLASQPHHQKGAGTHSAGLDIYALGIVAFEMLWKFNTRMERIHTIEQLKQGVFPSGFSDSLGKHGRKITECISAMLSQNGNGISIAEIKSVLSMLQVGNRERRDGWSTVERP